jgi:transposase
VTQVGNDTPGRAYYRRKLDEGKSRKEALRALKRQIAKTVTGTWSSTLTVELR